MNERSAAFEKGTVQPPRCILCGRSMSPNVAEPDVICPQCEVLGADERRALRNQAMIRLMRRDLTA